MNTEGTNQLHAYFSAIEKLLVISEDVAEECARENKEDVAIANAIKRIISGLRSELQSVQEEGSKDKEFIEAFTHIEEVAGPAETLLGGIEEIKQQETLDQKLALLPNWWKIIRLILEKIRLWRSSTSTESSFALPSPWKIIRDIILLIRIIRELLRLLRRIIS